MNKKIFVNLPVKDLGESTEFFNKLGFSFNQDFTSDTGTAMVVSDDISIMLLTEEFFQTFSKKEIVDTSKYTEVLIALTVDSREEADLMVEKAIEAGGIAANEPYDYGWMYGTSFRDIDGHMWELTYIDASKLPSN
jgi:uncharacterized protein